MKTKKQILKEIERLKTTEYPEYMKRYMEIRNEHIIMALQWVLK